MQNSFRPLALGARQQGVPRGGQDELDANHRRRAFFFLAVDVEGEQNQAEK